LCFNSDMMLESIKPFLFLFLSITYLALFHIPSKLSHDKKLVSPTLQEICSKRYDLDFILIKQRIVSLTAVIVGKNMDGENSTMLLT